MKLAATYRITVAVLRDLRHRLVKNSETKIYERTNIVNYRYLVTCKFIDRYRRSLF